MAYLMARASARSSGRCATRDEDMAACCCRCLGPTVPTDAAPYLQLLLGYLPRQMADWDQALHRKRSEYARFCEVCRSTRLTASHGVELRESQASRIRSICILVVCVQDLIVNVDALRDSDQAQNRPQVTGQLAGSTSYLQAVRPQDDVSRLMVRCRQLHV